MINLKNELVFFNLKKLKQVTNNKKAKDSLKKMALVTQVCPGAGISPFSVFAHRYKAGLCYSSAARPVFSP